MFGHARRENGSGACTDQEAKAAAESPPNMFDHVGMCRYHELASSRTRPPALGAGSRRVGHTINALHGVYRTRTVRSRAPKNARLDDHSGHMVDHPRPDDHDSEQIVTLHRGGPRARPPQRGTPARRPSCPLPSPENRMCTSYFPCCGSALDAAAEPTTMGAWIPTRSSTASFPLRQPGRRTRGVPC